MKKLLLYMGCAVAMLSACDPNDEFIDTLDAEAKAAGIDIPKEETYTLTADDYDIVEKGKYDNFGSDEEAAELIPTILAQVFSANSSDGKFEMTVAYNVYRGSLGYLKDLVQYKEALSDMESHELTPEDYDGMGTGDNEPGKYNNFSGSTLAEDYLPAFLITLYPDAEVDFIVYMTYKYYAGGGVTNTINEFWKFNGTTWVVDTETEVPSTPVVPNGVTVYELESADYDTMGNGPGSNDNFSSSEPAEKYLSVFLAEKYKLTIPELGDKVAVLYRYYKGKIDGVHTTVWESKEYIYDGSMWNEYLSTIVSSAPFKFNESVWAVVPPIKFVRVDADGEAIIFRGAEGNGAIIEEDYALVGNGYYKNFDVRAGKAEETEAVRIEKLSKIIKNKYDDLALDQVYFIQYNVYAGDEGIESQDTDDNGLWDIYLKAVEDN